MELTYKLYSSISGIGLVATDKNGKTYSIPFDETNSDYIKYLEDTDGGLELPESVA